jgi:polymerase delta-interacting protein 2
MTWQNIGIDYVSSEDILPYTSTEKLPIENELFSKFLMQDSESSIFIIINFSFKKKVKLNLDSGFIAREALKSWQERNIKWLEFSDVYSEISNNVRVTIIPFYIGMKVMFFFLKTKMNN